MSLLPSFHILTTMKIEQLTYTLGDGQTLPLLDAPPNNIFGVLLKVGDIVTTSRGERTVTAVNRSYASLDSGERILPHLPIAGYYEVRYRATAKSEKINWVEVYADAKTLKRTIILESLKRKILTRLEKSSALSLQGLADHYGMSTNPDDYRPFVNGDKVILITCTGERIEGVVRHKDILIGTKGVGIYTRSQGPAWVDSLVGPEGTTVKFADYKAGHSHDAKTIHANLSQWRIYHADQAPAA